MLAGRRFGAFQRYVFPGGGIIQGLQMREDGRVGQGMPDFSFDAFDELVALVNAPGAGHEHMHRNEAACAGLAGAEGVKLHFATMLGQNAFDCFKVLRR